MKNKKGVLSRRSIVGLGKNLGTRTMKSAKDYNRKNNKVDLRKLDETDRK